ncbi:Sedlin [Ascobolus immersus RN42]|uniref:Sedlin n=1 Tax=Ascobolus immersus RN42 TaxID=1160509 RepID=A0A3N4HNT8_ASCIM|nr:Sedlin [Ascobolus immersus RN42]
MSSFYFVILGTKDNPLYEAEFGTFKQGGDGVSRFREEQRHMNQFIAHASLDIVEEIQWNNQSMYLKVVDKFYGVLVSCFLTAGNIKFLLLHEVKSEDAIRNFFTDVYDLYTKTLMNPFYSVNQTITSPIFDQRVKQVAKKYL